MSNKPHNQTKHRISEGELDALLGKVDFLEVPQQFTNKVMQGIDELPQTAVTDHPSKGKDTASDNTAKPQSEWWQWAALIGGGIPALLQILAFIFSMWNVASLG